MEKEKESNNYWTKITNNIMCFLFSGICATTFLNYSGIFWFISGMCFNAILMDTINYYKKFKK